MKPIRLFLGRSGWRCGNAGDEFSVRVVERIAGRPARPIAEPENADFAAGGSILHRFAADWSGTVWGSGLIRDEDRALCSGATVLALRGPLTMARWKGLECDVFGDPGLLVPEVWAPEPRKRYRIGIIPHYIDSDDARVYSFAQSFVDEVTTIDVCGRVQDVLRALTECDVILSSSLHGIVFADAYGIPAAWIQLSDKVVGGSFKFRDYRAGLGLADDWVPDNLENGVGVNEMVDAAMRSGPERIARVPAVAARLRAALVKWALETEAAETQRVAFDEDHEDAAAEDEEGEA